VSANESRPAGAASELIAASKTSLSQPRPSATRFDSRRVRARRLIVREFDEFLGIFHYPDPAVIYAAAPSREAALNE
jgi:hypothetical protein